jgi:hypothetical protein
MMDWCSCFVYVVDFLCRPSHCLAIHVHWKLIELVEDAEVAMNLWMMAGSLQDPDLTSVCTNVSIQLLTKNRCHKKSATTLKHIALYGS